MRSNQLYPNKTHRLSSSNTIYTACLLFIVTATLFLSACASGPTGTNASATTVPQTTSTPSSAITPTPPPSKSVEIQETVLVKHLTIPWGLAFLPDGQALVSE